MTNDERRFAGPRQLAWDRYMETHEVGKMPPVTLFYVAWAQALEWAANNPHRMADFQEIADLLNEADPVP